MSSQRCEDPDFDIPFDRPPAAPSRIGIFQPPHHRAPRLAPPSFTLLEEKVCAPLRSLAPSAPSALHESRHTDIDPAHDSGIAQAIRLTLPTNSREDHLRRRVFTFARYLKGLLGTRVVAAARLRPILRRWHKAASSGVRVSFEDVWALFLEAWPRVLIPAGEGPFDKLWAKSATAAGPKAAANYDDPRVRRLVTFCWLLHRHVKGGTFFLDCRRVGALLDVNPTTAWRWLSLVLVADGVLQLVARGSRATARANEWRYIADRRI
jgi:hypothetical protein